MGFVKGHLVKSPGRPPKRLDADALALVEELAMRGTHVTTIAHRAAGVSVNTFRSMLERDSRVRSAMERGRARQHDYLVDCLTRQAERNPIPAIFMLKARHGYRDQGPEADARPTVVINLPGSADPAAYAKLIQPAAIEGDAKPEGDDDGTR